MQPGGEAAFLAPLDIGKIPGVGKVTQKGLRDVGIERIGQLAELDPKFLEESLGKMGLALAGKARGLDSGAWFEGEIGSHDQPKSISHETTFTEDTRDAKLLDATLAKLVQLVGRRLREHKLYSHTIQLKLRYSDFSTITRARTLGGGDSTRHRHSGQRPRAVSPQLGSIKGRAAARSPRRAVATDRRPTAADRDGAPQEVEQCLASRRPAARPLRETAVGLAAAMGHGRRERVHENPAGLPGREAKPSDSSD